VEPLSRVAARRFQVSPSGRDRPSYRRFLLFLDRLVVEVDGDTHEVAADLRRNAFLQSKGFSILRFTNAEVGGNIDGVMETILLKARALPPRFTHPPTPSLEREGEE